ncbi:GNAT family N-acetyltransferase [Burkholderia seminalis]|uniref:GNAT family N-acetyltransferase n=1 Tax=Burkholderia seminalis TaxID=488731 RepID=UPI00158C1BE5|nr:GNAT family N-acetyltransferase [Burkholderia seminalis]
MRQEARRTPAVAAQDERGTVRLVDGSGFELRALLLEHLKRHSADRGWPHDERTLEVVATTEGNGAVVGGLVASLLYDRLYVDLIHVDECFRGRGLGERLLLHAEAWARKNGASHAWLHTYAFQAPAFYLRCGYAQLAMIGDAGDPQAMTFFAKRIA